jgi:hypothetical protein
MAVPTVTVEICDPYGAHTPWATLLVSECRYGFSINGPNSASFLVAVNDANANYLDLGAMVRILRSDPATDAGVGSGGSARVHPWVGFIRRIIEDEEGSSNTIECDDHAGALFGIAAEPLDWPELALSSGEWIRRVFADANGRAAPPLMCELPRSVGPTVPYTPTGGTLLDFLAAMVRGSGGWEWALGQEFIGSSAGTGNAGAGQGPSVLGPSRTFLRWEERLGADRTSIVLESGRFVRARRTRDVRGFIGSATAVGGTGVFRNRARIDIAAAQASQGSPGSNAPALRPRQQPRSPALTGTRVVVEPSITGAAALAATARREHQLNEHVAETIELALAETEFDAKKLELGSVYTYRSQRLNFGRGLERLVRLKGFSLGQDGVIECVVDVIDEDSFWARRDG